jgi:TolB-like protein/class 3 adenylate cyclase/Tfp pilus assembly protein PilF
MPAVRRLTAILAADVAGYSRLMGADEEGTHERLKAHLGELVNPKIEEHRGRIVKNTGDGLLVEFPSVIDAVRCAVEVQRAMIDRNAEEPEDRRIIFRIGINLGDVIIDGDDIYGDGVNIAARLEALAEPGGLCISRVVRDQIRDKLSYPLEGIGEQSVKNIARPVRVYAMSAGAVASTPLVAVQAQPGSDRRSISPRRVVIAASASALIALGIWAWWMWPSRNSPTASIQAPAPASQQSAPAVASGAPAPGLSFVVLPFANLSNDPDQEYFADGITDDLTTDLSRISDSFVIAHTTALTYKGKPVDVRQIGRELGVRYVIEGSVRRAGDQVQVNAQLIDTETGAHVWADRFDTDRTNLAKAQSEITGRLARTLNVELFQAASRWIEKERPTNPDARDFAMRAWARVLRGPQSLATFDEALRMNQRALEIDPESVFAKNNMASILVGYLSNGLSRSVQQDQARSEQLFHEVLEHDPNDARAHFGLGILRRVQNRLDDARIELETGIALEPNNTVAFRNLGLTLMQMGEPAEAIPYIEKSIRLSPHDPTVYNSFGSLGQCHLLLGHLDQAIEFLQKAQAADPRRPFGLHLLLAGAFSLRGDLDEAKAEIAEAQKLKPEVNSLAAWRAYAPWITSPPLWSLREKTVNVGLRRAGFPDE